MKTNTNYNIVYVIWDDATSVDSWTDIKELKSDKCAEIHTTGFLIDKNKNCTIVALNIDTVNNSASCTMYIPNNMIKKIIYLDKNAKIK